MGSAGLLRLSNAPWERLGGPDCLRGGGHVSRVGAAIGTASIIAAYGRMSSRLLTVMPRRGEIGACATARCWRFGGHNPRLGHQVRTAYMGGIMSEAIGVLIIAALVGSHTQCG